MLSINRLDQQDSQLLLEGARAKAREIGVPMCIAVTDESGTLLAFERMDGAKVTSVTIAQNKAFTAAGARKATSAINEACVPGSLLFGIHTAFEGRFCVVGGGVPVLIDGEVVGAIGASTGTPQQDEECAQAGIDHFMSARSAS
jgi:uncharacterized protein GlcG (DUF336 family)